MKYSKINKNFVCKMAMLLAFVFVACSENNGSVAGGTGGTSLRRDTVNVMVSPLVNVILFLLSIVSIVVTPCLVSLSASHRIVLSVHSCHRSIRSFGRLL